MATEMVRTSVLILGGGVGGMVAAYWLTSTPELSQLFEVTVHQMGWHPGGKGARGRNPDQRGRIEENGLHIWFSFHDNAFLTMWQCYDELDEIAPRPEGCPIRTFEDAFAPSPVIGLYDYYDGQWLPHAFAAPEKPSILHPELGMEGPLPSIWHLVSHGIEWAVDPWDTICDDFGLEGPRFSHLTVHKFVQLADHVEVDLDEFDVGVKRHLVGWSQKVAGDIGRFNLHNPEAHAAHFLKELVITPLVAFKDELWEDVVESRCDNPRLRIFFTTFDTFDTFVTFVSAMAGGPCRSHLDERLPIHRRPGSAGVPGQARSSPVHARTRPLQIPPGWYGAAFAHDCMGDARRAGIGDTIRNPFYEVLAARGVRFEFFHEATELVLDDDGIGDGAVTAIRMTRQAEILGSRPHAPLADVGGLPCWPNWPLWDQLVDGDALRADGAEFEHGQSAPSASEFVLTRGQDFDRVVLAIPPAAQESLCRPLRGRHPAYAALAAHWAGVMTQAGQVWTRSSFHDMGSAFGVRRSGARPSPSASSNR
jgi:hypothetical protein